MKKVLLIIFASLLSFTSANALELGDTNFTIGLSGVNAVYAGEGTEHNYDESGSLKETTQEYGAFSPAYAEIFAEVGTEKIAVGVAFAETFSTPTNVNETGGEFDGAITTSVNAAFEDNYTIYGLARGPWGLYAKLGWTQVDVIVNETQKSGNTYGDTTTQGWVVGFGLEKVSDNGFGIRAELLGHEFEDVKADNGVATTGNYNEVKIDNMMGASAKISVLKTF